MNISKNYICLESFVSKIYSTHSNKDICRMNKGEIYTIVSETNSEYVYTDMHIIKSKRLTYAIYNEELIRYFTPLEEYRNNKVKEILQ